MKKDTWYKVFYEWVSTYNGNVYVTFDYCMNEDVKRMEDKHKKDGTYIKTEEWIIK